MLDVYEFDSEKEGPTLALFGAVHGNEIAGPVALKPLVEDLKSGIKRPQKGKLIIVPVCNPKAYEENVRYIDVNLNRLFGHPSPQECYEAPLAKELMEIILRSDYILDIHSTHTSGDPAFVFAEEGFAKSLPFAKAIGVEKIFLGWNDVYQEEDFASDAFALKSGRAGLTLECGYHNDTSAREVALRGVAGALDYTGVLPSKEPLKPSDIEYYRFKFFERQKEGDAFVKPWKHLDPVKKGDPVFVTTGGEEWCAPEDGYILIPNPSATPGDEMFYFGVKG